MVVIATTQQRESLDPAILRPGRLDQHIAVPLPDAPARAAILRSMLARGEASRGLLARAAVIAGVAEETQGFSGADLENLCREACMAAIRRDPAGAELTEEDMMGALCTAAPSGHAAHGTM